MVHMVGPQFNSTRRSLLGALAGAAAVPLPLTIEPIGRGFDRPKEELPVLRRTSEGRTLSRARYHNAEGFFRGGGSYLNTVPGRLYNTGIVIQLALSSHLLDVGFDDVWCAKHIGLHVAKSLHYANASGLSANSPHLARLVGILSPYCRWRDADVEPTVAIPPFSSAEIKHLTRELLECVREVTGHSRPAGWRAWL